MEWNKGYTAEYRATFINPGNWRDEAPLEIVGGSIKRESEGLKESGAIECRNYNLEEEKWIRVWMDTKQEGNYFHTPIFTGLVIAPSKTMTGKVSSQSLTCYSVLKPLQDIKLVPGWYCPRGVDLTGTLKSLLDATPAPVEISKDEEPKLTDYIIAEQGETRLSILWKILKALGWTLRISGAGLIKVEPESLEVKAVLDPAFYDVIEPTLRIEKDYYKCPNVLYVSTGDGRSLTFKDEDTPLIGIKDRGREIWEMETGVTLPEGEGLTSYTEKKLKELQEVALTVDYTRRYIPEITPGDILELKYPDQGLKGCYKVLSQSITLGYSGPTAEKVEKCKQ